MNTICARRIALASLLSVSLSACDNDNVGTVTDLPDGGSRIEMIPPQKIAMSRAVEPTALFIKVTVDGEPVTMELNSDGVRFGNIALDEGTVQNVIVTWSESFEGAPLELAIANKPITVKGDASGNQEFAFVSSDFDYGFDDDQDERSNLQERNELSNPRDANDPPLPPTLVGVNVRIQLPNDRILENNSLADTITPIATVNDEELPLIREGNTWTGRTQATQNSSAFSSVTFYQGPGRELVLATAKFSQDVGDGSEFKFVSSLFESEIYDQDNDNLSNLVELIDGDDPLDSNSPVQDPCATSNFALGCTIDTDEDNKPDSQEKETPDTDEDGRPNYLESSLQDNDQDGRNAELDADDEDPCVPFATNAACVTQQTDTDQDGETDVEEGQGDADGDGIADYLESDMKDEDSDEVVDEADPENADPCIPSPTSAACLTSQTDTDLDGETDVEEGQGDADGDGIADYLESDMKDEDSDEVVDEADPENADPCIPSATSAACVASQTDTDLDGETDAEEGLGDADGDGIADYLESDMIDEDGDEVVDEADRANADPCIPSEINDACVASQTDTDLDGETDEEEGLGDADGDGIADYLESDMEDEDGDEVVDEADPENADPCIPSATSAACVALLTDTDLDGETDAEEGLGDADGDGIADYLESDRLDADADTVSDEADEANDNPCIPSEINDACGNVQRDSDDDGDTDLEEGDADTDNDGLPDYLESSIKDLDNDGVVDELDRSNGDPCIPSVNNPACTAQDTDSDGILDAFPDNCLTIPNPKQENNDNDALGDLCDPDDDNDDIPDVRDNCPFVPNPQQNPDDCVVNQ